MPFGGFDGAVRGVLASGLGVLLPALSAGLAPLAAHADLLIQLEDRHFGFERLEIRAPRIRVAQASANTSYRVFDAEMDAMVTVMPQRGVFYEEEPAALARSAEAFARHLRSNRAKIENRMSEAPSPVRKRWRELKRLWLDNNAAATARDRYAIDAIEALDEQARAAGFRCDMFRVTLTNSEDSVRVCLASVETIGAKPTELETLQSLLRYTERMRHAGLMHPGQPVVTPGLLAALIERTGRFVLGAARWRDELGQAWQVKDVWPTIYEDERFVVGEDLRSIPAPYKTAQ